MADNKTWLNRLRNQINPSHSDAADFWDSLQPEWRGVVLHAASIAGTNSFERSLAKCCWRELYSRVDSRGIAQMRIGIQQARNVFNGFGTLRRDDFTRRTTQRPDKPAIPERRGPEMLIAPHILQTLAAREHLDNQTEGNQ